MNPDNNRGPDPSPLMRLTTLYWESQVFLTANRTGLFHILDQKALGITEIADALELKPHPTRLLLKACEALGLVQEDTKEHFTNTPLSCTFMVPGKPGYLGDAVHYADNLYATSLEQALREGKPPMAPETYLGADKEKTRAFVYGMHNRALGIGNAMTAMLNLKGRQQLLDVGGGPGTYSALLTQQTPGLHSVVLDLPDVISIAKEIIDSMGATEQVSTLAGDYKQIPFPVGNDVVLISGVFHRETEENCRGLIQRAAEALQQGGLLIISDVFTSAGGAEPTFATLFGLNMMLSAPDGGVHADADVAEWMKSAGFDSIKREHFPPPMPHRIVMGSLK